MTDHARTIRSQTSRLHLALQGAEFTAVVLPADEGVLCRLHGGPIHGLALRTYSTQGTPVWRWHVDHLAAFKASRRHWLALGLPVTHPLLSRGPRPPVWRPRGPKLELSLLGGELDAVTSWLPAWVAAQDAGTEHAPLPVPTHRDARRLVDYVWTTAADETHTAELRARQTDEVTPC